MLVANSPVQGIISIWHLNSFVPFKDAGSGKQEEGVEHIWRQKIRCAVCYYTCGDRVRGEEVKGVGSVPTIRCKLGK